MVLVDYSESDGSGSDSDTAAPHAPAAVPKAGAGAARKQPFQKVVDRSNRGKIVVSLPPPAAAAAAAVDDDEPPAKRARTSAATLFSGFNSMLPPPKNASRPAAAVGPPGATRPGVVLKTSAEPGFRRGGDESEGHGAGDGPAARDAAGDLPGQGAEASPSPAQEPAAEVKLVGKPLMFRPLSVARAAKKKNARDHKAGSTTPSSGAADAQASASTAPPPKKASLFSLHREEVDELASTRPAPGGAYEPLFEPGPEPASQDPALHDAAQARHGAPPAADPNSLDTIADDLQLTAAARRELFGRGGSARAAKQVINFNTDEEYHQNEALRAAGEEQIHQPVRALQGGKHSLRQLVQNVSSQREALEDSFAKGKNNRKEASSRYGW